MSETPLFDELEEKWNAVGTDRRICDKYMRCFLIETGAEWYEDDEGNEVFLVEEESPYVEAGLVVPGDRVVPSGALVFDCATKPKFKLFGRNQGTDGTL